EHPAGPGLPFAAIPRLHQLARVPRGAIALVAPARLVRDPDVAPRAGDLSRDVQVFQPRAPLPGDPRDERNGRDVPQPASLPARRARLAHARAPGRAIADVSAGGLP